MSTGVMADLITAVGKSPPETLESLSASGTSPPYVFATDWEISSVDSLTQNTSGPYCEGDSIEVQINFSGEGAEFEQLKNREANYTVNTSQNCTLQGKTPPTLTFTIDSGAGGTSNNTIGVTFDNAFNDASGVGTEQTTTFDVTAYKVTITNQTYDSTNDDVTIEYEICCGSPDYNVDLYRDNDGTPTLAAEDTKTSANCGGTAYTITDTNPNSGGTSDEYRIDVTDNSGSGTTVTDTVTVNFPT